MTPRIKAWQLTEPQILLLSACLADEGELEFRLRAWEDSQPWLGIDGGSHRVLPYLYRRITAAGLSTSLLGRLKGVYQRYWIDGIRRSRELLGHVGLMEADGFQPLLLKGTALQGLVYGSDAGARPATDVDILVTPAEIEPAVRWWRSRGFVTPDFLGPQDRHAADNSLGLSSNGLEIDINWRIHPFGLDSRLEDRMRGRAVPVMIEDRAYSTLSLPDHLLHALLHGSGWNRLPPIRWVLDAHLIAHELDDEAWRTFGSEVAAGGYRTPILPMLQYLRRTFDTPVPDRVVREIERLPASLTGTLGDWYLSLSHPNTRRATRIAFAQYLAEREVSMPNPWRHYPTRAPKVAFGIVSEYAHRQRRRRHAGWVT